MKKFATLLVVVSGMIILTVGSANAATIPIDLNDFYADPTVTVAADGSSADFVEDFNSATVLLSNDPFFGDPGIAVPPDLLTLNFSYEFTLGNGNFDDFYAKVFDGDTGNILDDFFIDASGSGTVSWDLSGIDPAISLLGLEFQLNSWDFNLDSTLNVHDVHMVTAAAPIPEPATMMLVGTGLIGLLGFGRKKFKTDGSIA